MGVRRFVRGDMDREEEVDEQKYFLRMAKGKSIKYVCNCIKYSLQRSAYINFLEEITNHKHDRFLQ
jgi:hypothetical protein